MVESMGPACHASLMNAEQTVTTQPSAGPESPFRIPRVAILAFYFGVFGVHRFYTRRPILGILQLITFGGFGLWALVDHIMLAWGTFTDSGGNRITRWT